MSNGLQLCPTDFSKGAGQAGRGGFAPSPLVTGLCPIVLKYMSNTFYRRAKIFPASYGPGFAPQCCVDRLATVEALKINVHLLLLWLATLQVSATVSQCLRKRRNWSISIRFNSQLKVSVAGAGLWQGGPAGTLFRCPTPTEGPETEGQARNQLETPRDEEFSERGTIFFNYVQ